MSMLSEVCAMRFSPITVNTRQVGEMIGWVNAFVVTNMNHYGNPATNAIKRVTADGYNRAALVILR